jgi:hypothetical protein
MTFMIKSYLLLNTFCLILPVLPNRSGRPNRSVITESVNLILSEISNHISHTCPTYDESLKCIRFGFRAKNNQFIIFVRIQNVLYTNFWLCHYNKVSNDTNQCRQIIHSTKWTYNSILWVFL